jgi:hemerythrin-like domain-containing protein
MSEVQESNIAVCFRNIHTIITRGVSVSMESVSAVILNGFQDEGRRKGLFNYIRALSAVLISHHLTEDKFAFPYFRDKMPEAPFDDLTEWHQEMERILGEIKLAVDNCEKNDQLEANLKNLEKSLTRLNEEWQPHIQVETDEFISKADALLPVEEQRKFIQQFAEFGQKLAIPPALTVPFMLYNLPAEDRNIFSEWMPAEVLQNLVPVVWKEEWASMTPFLLA